MKFEHFGIKYKKIDKLPVIDKNENMAGKPFFRKHIPGQVSLIISLHVLIRYKDFRSIIAAQEELLTAKRLAAQVDASAGEAYRNAQGMLEAARRRLAYWDITSEQIARVESTREVTRTLTLVAPVNGIVLEKDVVEGQRVAPGMRLYRLADLSTVWVEGELFEQDLQFVQEGARAHIEVAAYPGVHLMGRVSFVYPTVDERSRTNRVRVTLANPDLRLKPGMFATVYFDVLITALPGFRSRNRRVIGVTDAHCKHADVCTS